ncbi:MAG: hypothetical protein V4722_04435 [Bacteroidota bacterium]
MEATFPLPLTKKELHLLVQCCNSGITESLEQKEKVDIMNEMPQDAREYLKDYYDKRTNAINATMHRVQQCLTDLPAQESEGRPFEELTTTFPR